MLKKHNIDTIVYVAAECHVDRSIHRPDEFINTNKERVYNPFDVLLFLKKRQFGNYWLESATPSFLIFRG